MIPVPYRTGLLWVTYGRDVDWFRISAKSFRKFATGFDWAKCVVPNPDLRLFDPICKEFAIHLAGFDEWPGLGFNSHQMMKCYGDHHFPAADIICHIDADSVFAKPVTPADWFVENPTGGHPLILLPATKYKHFLREPLAPDEMKNFMGYRGRVMDFNRGQYWWKFAVDFALGWDEEFEYMAWMPLLHHRSVYGAMRKLIAERHGVPGGKPDEQFDGYVKAQRNDHPQSFCEFNTLGAVAHKYFPDLYNFHDMDGGLPWVGKVIQSHSRSPMEKEHNYGEQVDDKSINSPIKLFRHLGLV